MSRRPELVPIKEAATDLGVPRGSLRSAAEQAGLLVRMGRTVTINRNDYEELVRRCQGKPPERDSTSDPILGLSISATRASLIGQPALATAAKLKKRSRPT